MRPLFDLELNATGARGEKLHRASAGVAENLSTHLKGRIRINVSAFGSLR
jgi:hypothetical protein